MFTGLFKNKNTTTLPRKRNSIEGVAFRKKSAVVLVGVSGIGKTTFAKSFVKKNPEFEMISYDFYFRNFAYFQNPAKHAENAFKKRINTLQDDDIIIDKMILSPKDRVELIDFLHSLNYQVHLVYFTQEYTKKHISERLVSRAIEMVLFSRLSSEECKVLMNLDLDIIQLHADNNGKSVDEVIEEFENNPSVLEELEYHVDAYNEELLKYDIMQQEEKGEFMLGLVKSDYYYEITD